MSSRRATRGDGASAVPCRARVAVHPSHCKQCRRRYQAAMRAPTCRRRRRCGDRTQPWQRKCDRAGSTARSMNSTAATLTQLAHDPRRASAANRQDGCTTYEVANLARIIRRACIQRNQLARAIMTGAQWLNRCRRLAKDFENLSPNASAFLASRINPLDATKAPSARLGSDPSARAGTGHSPKQRVSRSVPLGAGPPMS